MQWNITKNTQCDFRSDSLFSFMPLVLYAFSALPLLSVFYNFFLIFHCTFSFPVVFFRFSIALALKYLFVSIIIFTVISSQFKCFLFCHFRFTYQNCYYVIFQFSFLLIKIAVNTSHETGCSSVRMLVASARSQM